MSSNPNPSASPSASEDEPQGPEAALPVARVALKGREIVVLGTAHISSRSVEDVRKVIQDEQPDRVCIELDEARYNSLVQKQSWQ
ncbi:MAG: TraB/GumN family protein, partial [Spirochaetales bacterium]|nr:TraB/GumN family protein [Spirochaetales bacterium]